MAMQIRRTLTADNPPTALAEGQLAVEMASTPPKLWVGVPVAISSNQRVQLNDFATQAWITSQLAGYLPLTGGTLATVTGLAGGGSGMEGTISSVTATDWLIGVTNSGAGRGIGITNSGTGLGIFIQNNTTGGTLFGFGAGAGIRVIGGTPGHQIYAQQSGTGYAIGAEASSATSNAFFARVTAPANIAYSVWRTVPTTRQTFTVLGSGAVSINTDATPTNCLQVQVEAINYLRVGVDGALLIGSPTGTAVTGAGNINVQGSYYVNGVSIGTGPFLPLTGGRVTGTTYIGTESGLADLLPFTGLYLGEWSFGAMTGNGAFGIFRISPTSLALNANLTQFMVASPDVQFNAPVSVGGPTGPAVTAAGNVNVSGGYYVNGVSIGTGPFLPLTGGTLTGPLTGTIAGGSAATFTNNDWANQTLTVTNQAAAGGNGDAILTNGNVIVNGAITSTVVGGYNTILLENDWMPRFRINNIGGTTGLQTAIDAAFMGIPAWTIGMFYESFSISRSDLLGTFIDNPLSIDRTSGTTTITGPLVLNALAVTLGDPDSGGTGYRCLRVPN